MSVPSTPPKSILPDRQLYSSVFFLSQFLTSLLWVSIAEKHGKRAVLFTSLLGNALTVMAFGTSKNLRSAITIRFAMGVFNGERNLHRRHCKPKLTLASLAGAVGVARSAVQNITDPTNESRAFTYMGLSWMLGGIVGSIIGGLAENPVRCSASEYLERSLTRLPACRSRTTLAGLAIRSSSPSTPTSCPASSPAPSPSAGPSSLSSSPPTVAHGQVRFSYPRKRMSSGLLAHSDRSFAPGPSSSSLSFVDGHPSSSPPPSRTARYPSTFPAEPFLPLRRLSRPYQHHQPMSAALWAIADLRGSQGQHMGTARVDSRARLVAECG